MGTRNAYFPDVEERRLLAAAARAGLKPSAYIRARVMVAVSRDLRLYAEQQARLEPVGDVEAWQRDEATRLEVSSTLAAHAQLAAADEKRRRESG